MGHDGGRHDIDMHERGALLALHHADDEPGVVEDRAARVPVVCVVVGHVQDREPSVRNVSIGEAELRLALALEPDDESCVAQ